MISVKESRKGESAAFGYPIALRDGGSKSFAELIKIAKDFPRKHEPARVILFSGRDFTKGLSSQVRIGTA